MVILRKLKLNDEVLYLVTRSEVLQGFEGAQVLGVWYLNDLEETIDLMSQINK